MEGAQEDAMLALALSFVQRFYHCLSFEPQNIVTFYADGALVGPEAVSDESAILAFYEGHGISYVNIVTLVSRKLDENRVLIVVSSTANTNAGPQNLTHTFVLETPNQKSWWCTIDCLCMFPAAGSEESAEEEEMEEQVEEEAEEEAEETNEAASEEAESTEEIPATEVPGAEPTAQPEPVEVKAPVGAPAEKPAPSDSGSSTYAQIAGKKAAVTAATARPPAAAPATKPPAVANGDATAKPRSATAPPKRQSSSEGPAKGCSLYVRDVRKEWTEEKIKEAFGCFEKVVSVELPAGKAHAFLSFGTPQGVKAALAAANSVEIDGVAVIFEERTGGSSSRAAPRGRGAPAKERPPRSGAPAGAATNGKPSDKPRGGRGAGRPREAKA